MTKLGSQSRLLVFTGVHKQHFPESHLAQALPWIFSSLLPTQPEAVLQRTPLCTQSEGQHLQTETSCCTPRGDQGLPVAQTPI